MILVLMELNQMIALILTMKKYIENLINRLEHLMRKDWKIN